MIEKEEIIFKGTGINSDDAKEFMPPGDGIARRNVFYSTSDNGVVVNIPGNILVSTGWTHDSSVLSLRVVGSCVDTENNRLYYLILGTTGSGYINSLVEYDYVSETFSKVFWDIAELELDPNIYINDSKYVNGWIYYNGGVYGPKKLNVELAKNFTLYDSWVSGASYSIDDRIRTSDGRIYKATTAHSGVTTDPTEDTTNWVFDNLYCYPCDYDGTTTAPLKSPPLSLINLPPTQRALTSYGTDTNKLVNNVRRQLFQFTYRYKYRNHGYSRSAPISDVTLPEDEETSYGEILNDISVNNYINVSFDAGDPGVVEWVELLVRTGNNGVWKLVDKIDPGVGTYKFYNDHALIAVDNNTINTLADSVPKKVNALEFISENVFLLGGVTEGFDNVDIDVSLTYGTETVMIPPGTIKGTFSFNYSSSSGGTVYSKAEINSIYSSIAPAAGDTVKIIIKKQSPEETLEVTFDFIGSTETDFKNECVNAINGASSSITASSASTDPPVPSLFTITGGDFYVEATDNGDTEFIFALSSITVYDNASSALSGKYTDFKSGAYHPFAIVYYDKEMRPFAAQRNDDTTIYIPTLPEINVSSTHSTYDERFYIDWEIKHQPPSEAYYYQWFYACNTSIAQFWQYVLDEDNTAGVAVGSGTIPGGGGIQYTYFNISPLQNAALNFPASNLSTYTFQAGDRVRVLTSKPVSTSSLTYGSVIASSNVVDLRIVYFDDTNNRIYVDDDPTSHWGADYSSLVEIYRPRVVSDDNLLYYAYGPVYDIYESGGNRYHRGELSDQSDYTGTNPATGRFTAGDVYLIVRGYAEFYGLSAGNITRLFVQSPAFSDFYDSDSYNLGKVNIASDAGEAYLNNIRFSNKYLQDTQIDGLATFDVLDYKELPDKNGQIQAMRQLGDVLRVYQNNATVSIWIGKTEYVDASGQSTIASSTDVLGSIREQLYKYGTINPESVVASDRYVYGFDALNGVYWRDSYNGLFPISGKVATADGAIDYKMYSFFKDMGKKVLSSGATAKVVSGWDNENGLVYVAFKGLNNSSYNDAVVFKEYDNRWICFVDHNKKGATNYPHDTNLEVDPYVGFGQYRIFPTTWYDSTTGLIYGVYCKSAGMWSTTVTDLAMESVVYSIDPNTGVYGNEYSVGSNLMGTHTGSSGSSQLVDANKDWTGGVSLVGKKVYNLTDGSSGTISAYTATTVTATLSGGVNNYWNPGDKYRFGDDSDAHGSPALIVADDGHILVFHEEQRMGYNNHNDRIQILRSDNPHDISSWTNALSRTTGYFTTVGDYSTYRYAYPSVVKMADGTLFMAVRRYTTGNKYVRIFKSTDHGVTWDSGYDVVDSGSSTLWTIPHIVSDGVMDTIYMVVNLEDTGSSIYRESFVLKSVDGKTWTDIAGNGAKNITTSGAFTITELRANEFTMAGSASEPNGVWGMYMTIGKNGTPHFTVVEKETTPTTHYENFIYYYSGGWQSKYLFDTAALIRFSPFYNSSTHTYDLIYEYSDIAGTREIHKLVLSDSDYSVVGSATGETLLSYTTLHTDAYHRLVPLGNIGDYDSPVFVWAYSESPSYDSGTDIAMVILNPKMVEYYLGYKNGFFSFMDGKMYKHGDSSATRAEFYGEQKDVIFDFVSNQSANITKTFETLELFTNDDWEVTDVEILANDSYPDGMVSLIPSGYFETREGKKVASFLRNMKTSSSTVSVADLYEGEVLRGGVMYVKMKNTSTSLVRLFKINIGLLMSKI